VGRWSAVSLSAAQSQCALAAGSVCDRHSSDSKQAYVNSEPLGLSTIDLAEKTVSIVANSLAIALLVAQGLVWALPRLSALLKKTKYGYRGFGFASLLSSPWFLLKSAFMEAFWRWLERASCGQVPTSPPKGHERVELAALEQGMEVCRFTICLLLRSSLLSLLPFYTPCFGVKRRNRTHVLDPVWASTRAGVTGFTAVRRLSFAPCS
jgi:hypothetical protein